MQKSEIEIHRQLKQGYLIFRKICFNFSSNVTTALLLLEKQSKHPLATLIQLM